MTCIKETLYTVHVSHVSILLITPNLLCNSKKNTDIAKTNIVTAYSYVKEKNCVPYNAENIKTNALSSENSLNNPIRPNL